MDPAKIWTFAAMKAQLPEVMRRALDEGPQFVGLEGAETVVVVSLAQYEALLHPAPPVHLFKDNLVAFPKGGDLDLEL